MIVQSHFSPLRAQVLYLVVPGKQRGKQCLSLLLVLMYTFTQRVLCSRSWHRRLHTLIFHDALAMAPTRSVVTRGKCAFVWTAAGSQRCMTLKLTDKVIVFNPTLLLRWWDGRRRHGGHSNWPRWAAYRWNANEAIVGKKWGDACFKLVRNTFRHLLCFWH